MLHMGQKHGGQRLLSESIGQLRHLDRGACVVCERHTVAAVQPMQFLQQPYTTSGTFGLETPFRTVGHQDEARGGTSIDQQLLQSSQPVPPREPLDDSPLPKCLIRNIVLTDRDKTAPLRASPDLGDGTPAMCGLSIRHGLGRKSRRSHERSPVLGLALPQQMPLAHWLRSQRGVDRNSELKQRLQPVGIRGKSML